MDSDKLILCNEFGSQTSKIFHHITLGAMGFKQGV